MKLTVKIKLLPTNEQANLLIETMKEANTVCNAISDIAWEKKIFNNFKLHHEVYYPYKAAFNLTSQILIRCIAKVSDAYKQDKKTKREFNLFGSICYDCRVMRYSQDNIVSLWAIGGRIKIPFVCHNRNYLPYIKGEADLVYKKGKFYLFQTVEVPEEEIIDVEEFIGVDMGLTTIAHTSNNVEFSADRLNKYREHQQKVRSSLQRKGTKGCKKVLKRLSGKERTHSAIINHTISKSIVRSAKEQAKGIAIEDLTNIRFTSKRTSKKFRNKLGKWNFSQLRRFIEYKSTLNGVKLVVVPPAYTSQTCSSCNNIGKRTNKHFECENCGAKIDADFNASINIASLGLSINKPEESIMFCSVASHLLDSKPIINFYNR